MGEGLGSVDHPDGPADPAPDPNGKTALLGAVTCVLFGAGLVLSETIGEVAVDVDLKPFFVPYLFIALTRYGLPTLSVALGAAVGEGILDVFEGYELDDPIGFIGYLLGFNAFGWYLHEVAADPTSTRSLLVGATLGASIQALFEGFAFYVFEANASAGDAAVSVVGNTVTHGFLLGGIPLVFLVARFGDRIQSRLT